ncbi:MAG: hypothetical protein J5842_09160 [Lachnospiraceae bacterium]|nr:hypothetical protein [Lachnospiraceae bacterium]
MLTTLRKELEKAGIKLEDSIYSGAPDKILDYKLTIGDFVEAVAADRAVEDFDVLRGYFAIQQEVYAEDEEYFDAVNRLKQIKKQLKEKGLKPDELEQARLERKELSKNIGELTQKLEKRIEERLGFPWKEKKVLCYKNTVFLSWLDDFVKRLDVLHDLTLPDAYNYPMFISNIRCLEEAMGYGEQIGIVGGPCLFGIDEVIFSVKLDDGTVVRFDSCCGRRCLNENKTQATLEEFTQQFGQRIVEVELTNRKTGVTRQEYDSIYNLFSFAQVFNARCVIPLPDISYFKYAASDLKGLTPKLRDESMEAFKRECFAISDMYLRLIDDIAAKFPKVEYCVLHYRNEKLVELFYEKRRPYVENSSYLQKITNVSGKKDSIIDYITMLALPYYVYGTKTVVQLDSVDETDSGRKCNKIHKGDIRLCQLLYPEYLSPDMEHTIYNAPLEYKEYITV